MAERIDIFLQSKKICPTLAAQNRGAGEDREDRNLIVLFGSSYEVGNLVNRYSHRNRCASLCSDRSERTGFKLR